MSDHFLESDHLVKGIAELGARKTEAHIREMRATNKLDAREDGPTGIAFQPVVLHECDDSENDRSPARRSTKHNKAEKEKQGRWSRFSRNDGPESNEDH